MRKRVVLAFVMIISVLFLFQATWAEENNGQYKKKISENLSGKMVKTLSEFSGKKLPESFAGVTDGNPDKWYSGNQNDFNSIKGTDWNFYISGGGYSFTDTVAFGSTFHTDSDGDIYLESTDVGNVTGQVYYMNEGDFLSGNIYWAFYIYTDFIWLYEFRVTGNSASGYFYEMDNYGNLSDSYYFTGQKVPTPTYTYTLNMTISPSGSGTVSMGGTNCSSSCQQTYNSGTSVKLTATPKSGYVFEKWSGSISSTSNPYTTTMSSNKTVTANFIKYKDNIYYLPYFNESKYDWTGVALRNCSATNEANIDVDVYSTSGTLLDTETKTLETRGQEAFVVGDWLNREGWVKVSSDQPLTGLAFVGSNRTPSNIFDMSLIPNTSTTLQIPHVAQNDVYDSTIFICNPNTTSVTVTVKVFDKEGNNDYTKQYTISANGSLKIDVATLIQWSTLTGGSVEITANRGVAAFGLYDNISNGGNSCAGISAIDPNDQ